MFILNDRYSLVSFFWFFIPFNFTGDRKLFVFGKFSWEDWKKKWNRDDKIPASRKIHIFFILYLLFLRISQSFSFMKNSGKKLFQNWIQKATSKKFSSFSLDMKKILTSCKDPNPSLLFQPTKNTLFRHLLRRPWREKFLDHR